MKRYMYAITSERAYRVAEVPPTPPRRASSPRPEASRPLLDLQSRARGSDGAQVLWGQPSRHTVGSSRWRSHERGAYGGRRDVARGSGCGPPEQPWAGGSASLREPRPYYYRVQVHSWVWDVRALQGFDVLLLSGRSRAERGILPVLFLPAREDAAPRRCCRPLK